MTRKYISDFLCAFIITAILFMCLGLLTNEDFFDNAVAWDAEHKALTLFGTRFQLDEKSLYTADKLFQFNDIIFGRGFSDAVRQLFVYALGYIRDMFALLVTAGRKLVGAI